MAEALKSLKALATIGAALLIATSGSAGEIVPSPVLSAIRQAGVVRVGVKTDVEPFGLVNGQGDIVGFEIDLAQDIAKRIGVGLVKVPVSTENRFQKLELGEVDLLLATVADSVERRNIATAIEPGYFETGVTVMLRPGLRLKDWNALRGKNICALQGAYFNRPTSDRYILSLETYKSVRDALLALEGARCDGFLYNAPAIHNLLKKEEFAGYSAPFPEALVAVWTIFVKKSEGGTEFDEFLGNVSADWYRTGKITQTAAAWGVKSSTWPTDELELWNRKSADGSYTCSRSTNGRWPSACRHIEFVKAQDVSGLQSAGLAFREMSGIDLSYIYDGYDRALFLKGLMYTMLMTALSIMASLVFGLAAAIASDARIPYFSRLVSSGMGLGRLIPPLLMMYFLYFGLGAHLQGRYDIKLSAVAVAVTCLGYYSGAIVMNAFAEAANHLRQTRGAYRLRLHTLGESMKYARWPIKQALINVTKMSMIASAIAIPELLSQVNLIMAAKGNMVVMMTTMLVTYYFVTSLWIRLFDVLEARFYSSGVAR